MTRWSCLAVVLSCLLSPAFAAAQIVVDGALPEPTMVEPPESMTAVYVPVVPAAPSREELRALLAARRTAHLAELRRYVAAGEFPINDVSPGYLNVFADPAGHLCAVANLMAFDGDRAMVDQTAQTTNYVRLVEVHEGALYDWILASGFTQEEIDRIQEPYFYQESQIDLEQQQRQLDRERNRLQRVLRRTIARLTRTTDHSLDVAVDRLMAAQPTPVG